MNGSAPDPFMRASMNEIIVRLNPSRTNARADPFMVRSGPVRPVVVANGRSELAKARASAPYLLHAASVVPFSETMSIAGAFDGGQIEVDTKPPLMIAALAGAHLPVQSSWYAISLMCPLGWSVTVTSFACIPAREI